MIKNLIFDVDGTIWNSTPIVARGWNRAITETGYSNAVITPQVLQREFGQPMDVIADHLFGDVTDMKRRQELLDLCCRYEQELLADNREDISYPGVLDGIRELSAKHALYIVSNCQCGYIELVMEKNKIGGFIRDHECFGNTGTCKGETIKLLMERNGIDRAQAAYATHVKARANNKKMQKRIAHEEALFYEELLQKEINEDREAHGKKPLKEKSDKDDDDNDSTPSAGGDPKEFTDDIPKDTKTIKCSTTDPESGWFRKGCCML